MFLNIVMLAGIAGAAVPLVLHLLARARYKSIDWGAMMFLLGTDQRQRQSTRLKQLILLLIRMAAVALLAIAMARPVVTGLLRTLTAGGHVDAAIVVDCSASMAVEENGRTRIDHARRAAVTVISQLERGDRVSLIATGGEALPSPLSSDLQNVAQSAASLMPTDGRTDITLALAEALSVLESGDSLNREIYLITDRQAVNWSSMDEAFAAAMARRIASMSRPPRIFFIPVGGMERRNVAIESFTAYGLPAVAKQPVELEIRVRNFGDDAATDIPLTVTDGQREIYRNTLAVPPDASSVVRATAQFDGPGCPVLTAQIRPDGLPFDDRRELAVLVTPPTEVLVISGDEREGMFRKESDFLRLALSPFSASGEQGPDPAKLTIITPAKWQRLDPRKHPVVVLANVSSLTESQASELEQYVYSGGGLLVSVGNMVQSDSYNALLYREGSGILPARLGDSMSAQATTSMSIIGLELSHPIFRFLRGRPDPVPTVTVTRHLPVQTGRSDARTLVTLATGEPLLLERSAGKGKVLLLATTLDADWNTLPLSGFYLPLMQSIVRDLAAAQLPELNIRQGEAISINVEGVSEDAPPKLHRPDGKEEAMELLPSVLSSELRYSRTQLAGRYELKLKAGNDQKAWTFISRPPADESDLTSYESGRLAQIRSELPMEILDARGEDLAGSVGKGRAGRELWLPLLAAALVLLGIETWFARQCSSEAK